MVEKRSPLRIMFIIANYILLVCIALTCIVPLLHVLFASISDPTKLIKHSGVIFWPLGKATLKGYGLVFHNKSILVGYANTIFYVVTSTALGAFFTALAGYILSRKNLLFQNALMFFITFTMIFSGGLIPFYLVVQKLGWQDSRLAIIIPGCLSVFNIIIMRTAMQQIPEELEESAKLDGAGKFIIFYKIYLPLSKATLAAIVLFYAVGQWNSWFGAMIFLTSKSKFPLQLILRDILINSNITSITTGSTLNSAQLTQGTYKILLQHCATIAATLPILCVYPFTQKYFESGVMIGSLKG
jgi:putative aldouronate transport system permease protein